MSALNRRPAQPTETLACPTDKHRPLRLLRTGLIITAVNGHTVAQMETERSDWPKKKKNQIRHQKKKKKYIYIFSEKFYYLFSAALTRLGLGIF